MPGSIRKLVEAARARRVAWRRARNLGAAGRPRPKPRAAPVAQIATLPRALTPVHWIGAAGLLAAVGGAFLLAAHARALAVAGDVPGAGGLPHPVAAFQPALPGIAFSVPEIGGISLTEQQGGALLIAAGMRSAPPVRIDLCSQMAGGRLLPLRIGYGFDDVARWAGRATQRGVALSGPDAADMPRVQVSGVALANFDAEPLQLRWDSADPAVRWIGDAAWGKAEQGAHGQVALRRDGWLLWRPDAAMHIQRRAGGACAAGDLIVQVVRAAPGESAARALVTAYPSNGVPATAWLAPGSYQVPADAGRGLEDQALFLELQRRGMIRLGAEGLAELAPRDLVAWRAAPVSERAAELAQWDKVMLDPAGVKLLKRLYRMADGEYVREQVRIFNGERRLLAWREAQGSAASRWRASVAGAPAQTSAAMPPSAARLFSEVSQGWAPWNRIDSWPAASPAARLSLDLPQAARGGESLKLMLVGRVGAVQGARLRGAEDACSGRVCPARDAARVLVFELLPGARSVTVDAAPLDMTPLAMPGDQQYRHLRVAAGRLDWQQLAPMAAVRRDALAEVRLEDRNGTPLWNGGAPTAAAVGAGLAPLLGIRPDQANSVAGMLGRLPAPSHDARLTLDLALQAASQGALECIGMRRGRWDGKTCSGGAPAPAGRHAGIVILDTETGDILAAAGAGNVPVTAANWNEVRNFDRTDPARSPLRLPALQHDGGAHSSPGSTFKVISALGLEQAATRDPQVEALLAGMPLPAINRLAREKGFAFQTDASSYPVATPLAHITNYKDQHLDRRAQDGKLGLAQALTYSLNTWFAWSGELSDRSLFGRAEGGAPDLQPLETGALDSVRPIVGMAHRLGFGQPMRLDGALLPPDYSWSQWDALQASASNIDPIHTRHELRQMSIGLRMQVTPLQMALAAGAVGQGRVIAPRLLLSLDRHEAETPAMPAVGVRLDRIRAGMKGVIDVGTAAGAFRDKRFDGMRRGLSGKTGTAPTGPQGGGDSATVWFAGWLEPGSLPRQPHRLALAAFVSHSEASGGEHAAPIVAAVLASALAQNQEQKGK